MTDVLQASPLYKTDMTDVLQATPLCKTDMADALQATPLYKTDRKVCFLDAEIAFCVSQLEVKSVRKSTE